MSHLAASSIDSIGQAANSQQTSWTRGVERRRHGWGKLTTFLPVNKINKDCIFLETFDINKCHNKGSSDSKS